MNIADKLREIAKDIRSKFPHHAKTLANTADQWEDIAEKERATITAEPVAESVDLDIAEKEVAADAATDEEITPTSALESPPPSPSPPIVSG